jgi:hypothetical protein
VLGKQLPLDLVLSQIARSVSFNPGSLDNLPRIPVAKLHADGIKEINVFPVSTRHTALVPQCTAHYDR